LNKARRAQLIPWSAIRDDGFVSYGTPFYDGPDHLFSTFRHQAERMRLDRQRDQPRRLYVACEAAGMAPQLARVADPYGIAVLASGGFDSLTDKHRLGEEWARAGQPVSVLHIGDYDPSGLAIFDAFAEDIGAFAEAYGGDVRFERIAVTPDQARVYNLPSAPPKPRDRRGFESDETWQAEALDPHDLALTLTDAIESRFDRAAYEAVLAEEEKTRLENQGDFAPEPGRALLRLTAPGLVGPPPPVPQGGAKQARSNILKRHPTPEESRDLWVARIRQIMPEGKQRPRVGRGLREQEVRRR
jgi:hypothetical protein